jgi:hypothetical protein
MFWLNVAGRLKMPLLAGPQHLDPPAAECQDRRDKRLFSGKPMRV